MSELLSMSGIVRGCAVIPRLKDGIRRDYVKMSIQVDNQLQSVVCAPGYLQRLLVDEDIIVPEPIVTDSGKMLSVPIKGLLKRVVMIGYEVNVENKTTYLDDKQVTRYHTSSGNSLRELYVLDGMDSTAHKLHSLEQQGVSQFALKTAAEQDAATMIESLKSIQNSPEVAAHIAKKNAIAAQAEQAAQAAQVPAEEPESEPAEEPAELVDTDTGEIINDEPDEQLPF